MVLSTYMDYLTGNILEDIPVVFIELDTILLLNICPESYSLSITCGPWAPSVWTQWFSLSIPLSSGGSDAQYYHYHMANALLCENSTGTVRIKLGVPQHLEHTQQKEACSLREFAFLIYNLNLHFCSKKFSLKAYTGWLYKTEQFLSICLVKAGRGAAGDRASRPLAWSSLGLTNFYCVMESLADLPGGRIRKNFGRNPHEDVLPLGTLLAVFSTSGYFLKYADKEVIMGIM